MKIRMYIDLPRKGYIEPEFLMATTTPFAECDKDYVRYSINVEIPGKHFGPVEYVDLEDVIAKETIEVLSKDK